MAIQWMWVLASASFQVPSQQTISRLGIRITSVTRLAAGSNVYCVPYQAHPWRSLRSQDMPARLLVERLFRIT
jgi:hypothetical protein